MDDLTLPEKYWCSLECGQCDEKDLLLTRGHKCIKADELAYDDLSSI